MSNQEMQFADPDWKPSQKLGTNNNQQEQEIYTPQPINNDSLEQNKWGSAPSSIPQQEGGILVFALMQDKFQGKCKGVITGNGHIAGVAEDPGSG